MSDPVNVDMAPAVVNLSGLRAGDRNLITSTVTSGGAPVDLTGRTFDAQARKAATDATAAMTAEVELLDATAGKLTLRWPGEQVTSALAGTAKWTGVWDLQVASPGEDPVTLCAGKITAEMDVSRA